MPVDLRALTVAPTCSGRGPTTSCRGRLLRPQPARRSHVFVLATGGHAKEWARRPATPRLFRTGDSTEADPAGWLSAPPGNRAAGGETGATGSPSGPGDQARTHPAGQRRLSPARRRSRRHGPQEGRIPPPTAPVAGTPRSCTAPPGESRLPGAGAAVPTRCCAATAFPAGRPWVLLLPGYLAGDRSLSLLARFLRRIGYRPPSGDRVQQRMRRQLPRPDHRAVRHARESTGRPIAVVGHSRGGHYAKSIAAARPGDVSHVVCLGSGLDAVLDVHPVTALSAAVSPRGLAPPARPGGRPAASPSGAPAHCRPATGNRSPRALT